MITNGCRASIVVPACRGTNFHCIDARSLTELVYFSSRRCALRADGFNDGIEEINSNCFEQKLLNPTFIIDNASAHKRIETILEHQVSVEVIN